MPTGHEFRTLLGRRVSFLLLLAMAACGSDRTSVPTETSKAPPAIPPSLLLVTVDTWRYDYIGASGAGKVATPALDRLASEGVYEREAETPCPLTTPAHATLFTGLLPTHHHVLDCVSYGLPAGLPTLAEAFKAAGFSTAAFVSSQTLSAHYGLGRGFEVYDDAGMTRAPDNYWETAMRDGAATTRVALDYLRSPAAGGRAFVWVHYYDLHLPYRSRPEYDARYPGDRYAAQAAFVDGQIDLLMDQLRRDGRRNWRVVVVGDHGEGLGDHGERAHGLALYRSTVRVPLIFFPRPEAPLVHARPWRIEDLAPTLRQWFDLPQTPSCDGESLFGPGAGERWLPLMSLYPATQFAVSPSLGVRRGDLVYLRQGGEELYDTSVDPDETHNLATDPGRSAELVEFRSACDRSFQMKELQALVAPTLENTPAELQGLQGLGYVGGFVPTLATLQRVPIRKILEDEDRFEKARDAFGASRDPGPMLQAYRDMLAKYPRVSAFYKDYGILLLQTGRQDEALAAFDRAVRLNPRDAGSMVNLGGLYLVRGKIPQAKVLLETALSISDGNPVAHKNLGIIYARYLHDPARAVAHYKRYLEIAPDADAPLIRDYIRQNEPGR